MNFSQAHRGAFPVSAPELTSDTVVAVSPTSFHKGLRLALEPWKRAVFSENKLLVYNTSTAVKTGLFLCKHLKYKNNWVTFTEIIS